MGILWLVIKIIGGIIALWILLSFTIIALILMGISLIIYGIYYYDQKDKRTFKHAGDW